MTLDRTTSAGLWSSIEIASKQGVNFFVTIVLARLLSPADFGTIALVAFLSGIAMVLTQSGFFTAIVRRDTSHEQQSSVFWATTIISSVVSIAILAAMQPVASFYANPVLASLLSVSAVQLILSSLVSVQTALLVRQHRFATLAKISLFSNLASGVLSIAAAAMGAGTWALGIQILTFATLSSALTWWVSRWRPLLHLRRRTLEPFLTFSGWVSLASVLEAIYTQGFVLIVAKRYGVHDLGLYNRAMYAQQLVGMIFATLIARIALPMFSERSDDREGLRRGFRRAAGLTMFINVPAMTGLAVLSDLVLHTLYGAEWVPAAEFLTLLSLGALFLPLQPLNLELLLARGEAASFFRIKTVQMLAGLSCILIGSFYGLIGLAIGQVVANAISLVMVTLPARRIIGHGLPGQIADVAGIFACAGVMAATLIVVRPLLSLPPAAALFALVLIGMAIYFGLSWLLRLASFRDALQIAEILWHRRRRFRAEIVTPSE